MDAALKDMILTVATMAENARSEYKDTEKWMATDMGSCMTVRVPTALLNRIRELAKQAGIDVPRAAS